MLKKKLKLPIKDFPQKPAITKRNELLTIKITPNHLSYSRFGVIISRHYDKRATNRNKLKRAIFNWIKNNINSLIKERDVLIIISPKVKSDSVSKDDIIKQLEETLN